MLAICRIPPCSVLNSKRRIGNSRLCCRAENQQVVSDDQVSIKKKPKVVVVGSVWAGLGAAHHLCKQVLQGFKHTRAASYYLYVTMIAFWFKGKMVFGWDCRALVLLFLKVVMNMGPRKFPLLLMILVFRVIHLITPFLFHIVVLKFYY